MEDYFKRLKDHPGLGVGMMFSMLVIIAALDNRSIKVWWHSLLLGIGCSLVVWTIILITNIKKDK